MKFKDCEVCRCYYIDQKSIFISQKCYCHKYKHWCELKTLAEDWPDALKRECNCKKNHVSIEKIIRLTYITFITKASQWIEDRYYHTHAFPLPFDQLYTYRNGFHPRRIAGFGFCLR